MGRANNLWLWLATIGSLLATAAAGAGDLDDVLTRGVVRHLGTPDGHFVDHQGRGLDVELVQGFAKHLGVRYEFVATDRTSALRDLTGQAARAGRSGGNPEPEAIRGDLLASGLTVLEWRRQTVAFSNPTLPSAVWLIARAESPLIPIQPTGVLAGDIGETKALLKGVTVLALAGTSLDPVLYGLRQTGAKVQLAAPGIGRNGMVPALLESDAETALLSVPEALTALFRWPGRIKVIGPVSERQALAAAFRPESTALRQAFNDYLTRLQADGNYQRLVQKYYPAVYDQFGDYFTDLQSDGKAL